MNPLKTAIISSSLIAAVAIAGEVKLLWEPNIEPDLAGYKVYWGTNQVNYPEVYIVGNYTNVVLSNLTAGVTYYFYATAYNSSGLESLPSDVVEYTIPADSTNSLPAPVNVRFK